MEAKDLRIGSWVNYKTENIAQEICSIQSDNTIRLKDSKGTNHGCYRMSYVEPIPLTEEWLIRMGFEVLMRKSEKGYKSTGYTYKGKISLVVYFDDGKLSVGFWQGNEKKYVHEFQNFFFALTGEELTIKK